jgi:uncharacterized protein YdbL (DUF1318 family)
MQSRLELTLLSCGMRQAHSFALTAEEARRNGVVSAWEC